MKTSDLLQEMRDGIRREYNNIPHEITATIHEHRAPTDASVKLLDEFEERAKGRIIEQIHIKNTLIDGVAIYFLNDYNDLYSRTYHLKFNINGNEHIIKSKVDDIDMFSLRDTFLQSITKTIAMDIMKQILPVLQKAI